MPIEIRKQRTQAEIAAQLDLARRTLVVRRRDLNNPKITRRYVDFDIARLQAVEVALEQALAQPDEDLWPAQASGEDMAASRVNPYDPERIRVEAVGHVAGWVRGVYNNPPVDDL